MSLSNFSGVNHRKWTAAIYFPNLHWSKILCSVVSPFQIQSFCTERWWDMTPKWPAAALRTGGKRFSLAHLSEVVISSGVWPFGPMGNTGVRPKTNACVWGPCQQSNFHQNPMEARYLIRQIYMWRGHTSRELLTQRTVTTNAHLTQ